MSVFRERMRRDLEIRGYAKKTCGSYLGAMKRLVRYFMRSPDELSPADINRYQHHLIQERGVSYSTLNLAVCAFRFFYTHTCPVDWSVERLPYHHKPRRLPVILSRGEVGRLLGAAHNPKHHAILVTIYACGLRLGEAVHLRVEDVDKERMALRIRSGKGAKDRYVPLPKRLLEVLRAYWRAQPPEEWLVPGKKQGCPLHPRSVQRAFENAARRADIGKGVSIHSLRHAFATHLLEDGAHIRAVQAILGHASLSTTAIYLHCTDSYVKELRNPLDRLPPDALGVCC